MCYRNEACHTGFASGNHDCATAAGEDFRFLGGLA